MPTEPNIQYDFQSGTERDTTILKGHQSSIISDKTDISVSISDHMLKAFQIQLRVPRLVVIEDFEDVKFKIKLYVYDTMNLPTFGETSFHGGVEVALFDTQIDSIQCLNFAQN